MNDWINQSINHQWVHQSVIDLAWRFTVNQHLTQSINESIRQSITSSHRQAHSASFQSSNMSSPVLASTGSGYSTRVCVCVCVCGFNRCRILWFPMSRVPGIVLLQGAVKILPRKIHLELRILVFQRLHCNWHKIRRVAALCIWFEGAFWVPKWQLSGAFAICSKIAFFWEVNEFQRSAVWSKFQRSE